MTVFPFFVERCTVDSIRKIASVLLIGAAAASLVACEEYSRGAKLFRHNECVMCHTINGKGGAVGPNLTYVGSRRSRDWIVQQIKKPSFHNPNTAMPSFAGRLSEKDINDLADYLSSLK
jgi:mono/diheme cytochrome c family protein